MQKIADAQDLDLLISAVGIENYPSVAPAYDCVLVAPHIQYKINEFTHALNTSSGDCRYQGLPYASFTMVKRCEVLPSPIAAQSTCIVALYTRRRAVVDSGCDPHQIEYHKSSNTRAFPARQPYLGRELVGLALHTTRQRSTAAPPFAPDKKGGAFA